MTNKNEAKPWKKKRDCFRLSLTYPVSTILYADCDGNEKPLRFALVWDVNNAARNSGRRHTHASFTMKVACV